MRELKAHRLSREINTLKVELYQHQEKCKHPRGTFEYGANTGNWCMEDDRYWVDCKCDVCLKKWTIYSCEDSNGYRNVSDKLTQINNKHNL